MTAIIFPQLSMVFNHTFHFSRHLMPITMERAILCWDLYFSSFVFIQLSSSHVLLSDFLTLSIFWLKSKFFVALLRYCILVAKKTDCVSAFCCFGQILHLNFSRLTKCDETDVWLCKIRILVHSGMLLCARLFVMHSAETNCGISCLARATHWQRTILHTKAEKYDDQVLHWFSGHLHDKSWLYIRQKAADEVCLVIHTVTTQFNNNILVLATVCHQRSLQGEIWKWLKAFLNNRSSVQLHT